MKFSFQGVQGAYSELAGNKLYPNFTSIPSNTFEEMFETVKLNQSNIAIVPIENSISGRVADTQRLIPDSNLKIIGGFIFDNFEKRYQTGHFWSVIKVVV